jgi:WD40 repeat protein
VGEAALLLLPDGRRALSWSNDRTLRLWDLEGAAEPRVLAGHEDSVNGALLLPDGRRALSWSDDGTLRLWDLDGAAEPRVLARHEDSVNGALLLPDGRRVLSWSGDRTLRLWDLERAAEVGRYDADAVVSAVAVTSTPPGASSSATPSATFRSSRCATEPAGPRRP